LITYAHILITFPFTGAEETEKACRKYPASLLPSILFKSYAISFVATGT
jgi:hypothetical protein